MRRPLTTFLGSMSKRRALIQIEAELAERLAQFPDIEPESNMLGRLVSESASINQRAPADDKYDVAKRLSALMAGP